MVNKETGTIAFNEFGISFVSNDIPKKKADEVYKKMDEIMAKAKIEFDAYLENEGLEAAMGVAIKKGY